MKAKIEIKLNFFPLAWTLHFVQPTIEIDRKKITKQWGLHQFELSPGNHIMRIYFSYKGKAECGTSQINFNIAAGEIKRFSYYMLPYLVCMGGIKIVKRY